MKNLPKSRNENIIMQNLSEEILIYDLVTNRALCLNETSARVYNHCDGATSFDELKRRYRFTDDLIFLALDGLERENLLEKETDYISPLAGISRREAIRRVGLATMIALPMITGLVAPPAANAASVACTSSAQCTTAGRTCCASGACVAAGTVGNGGACSANCQCVPGGAANPCNSGICNND